MTEPVANAEEFHDRFGDGISQQAAGLLPCVCVCGKDETLSGAAGFTLLC